MSGYMSGTQPYPKVLSKLCSLSLRNSSLTSPLWLKLLLLTACSRRTCVSKAIHVEAYSVSLIFEQLPFAPGAHTVFCGRFIGDEEKVWVLALPCVPLLLHRGGWTPGLFLDHIVRCKGKVTPQRPSGKGGAARVPDMMVFNRLPLGAVYEQC